MEGGLTTVLLLLAGSLAAVALFKSMGLPALMGYLLVGVAVGPHALGLMPEEGGAAVLAELRQSLGMALLVVTHDERLAQSADRCLQMQDGRWVS